MPISEHQKTVAMARQVAIEAMSDAGYSYQVMADAIRSTPGSVRVTIHNIRKEANNGG